MTASLPFPSDPDQEVRIPVASLQPVFEKLLVKASQFQFDAAVVAARLIEADLYGLSPYGSAIFIRILDAIDVGDIDPRGRVLTAVDLPALAVLDGSRAAGMVAATKAAELATSKAREQGVGLVLVANSQILGAAGVYARLIATEGLIGVCLSSSGAANVSPPGSTRPAVGNSALAYAIPLGSEPPLVFDSACGAESWGKLELLKRYGVPLPEDLLFDEQGRATTDLAAARALRPGGGELGFGLSLLISTLAGPLVGGKTPLHKKRRPDADDSQHVLLAIDPARCGKPEHLNAELAKTLAEIRSLPAEDANRPVRVPGDREQACFADRSAHGIPVHRSVAEEIRARAAKKKIEFEWPE